MNLKNKIKHYLLLLNKFFGIQFIPDIFNNINIEVSSWCNLDCKFCAYPKRNWDQYPKKIMNYELFKKIVNECINVGYKNLGLTPVTGEVFLDNKFFEKLKFLDEQKNLNNYYFYSNFIPINIKQIETLTKLKKIGYLGISIYGDDMVKFKKFTVGNENSYSKLIRNLKELNNVINQNDNNLKILLSHRTSKNFDIYKSEDPLSNEIKKLIVKKNVVYEKNSKFNNWGGLISNTDIKDLDIKLLGNETKKVGSCSLIYSRMTIGADGTVNACACRDVNYSLEIGNINKNSLREIINYKNDKYIQLIRRQENNDFPDVCKSCDFYKSIYSPLNYKIWSFKDKKIKNFSLNKVFNILQSR